MHGARYYAYLDEGSATYLQVPLYLPGAGAEAGRQSTILQHGKVAAANPPVLVDADAANGDYVLPLTSAYVRDTLGLGQHLIRHVPLVGSAIRMVLHVGALDTYDGQRLGLVALPMDGTLVPNPTLANGSIRAATFAPGALTSVVVANSVLDAIREQVLGRLLTPTDGYAEGSVGARLRHLDDATLHTGPVAAATANTVTLTTSASGVSQLYQYALLVLTSGPGAGQARLVTDYQGGTRVATVTPDWAVLPDATTTVRIYAQAPVAIGTGATQGVDSLVAQSVTAIVNAALAKLGAAQVTSVFDGSPAANAAKALFPTTRDAVLRMHPWNCAEAYATLVPLAVPPLFGYTYQYQLPADPYCLRVLDVNGATAGWRVHGRRLLTDAATVELRFTKRITDPAEYDALLLDVLSEQLAADLAIPITGQAALKELHLATAAKKLQPARTADAQEGTPAPPSADGDAFGRHGARWGAPR